MHHPRVPEPGAAAVGTLRQECVDHLIIFNQRHLRSVLGEFLAYYNRDRPHWSFGLEPPQPAARPEAGPVRSRTVLGGLHHVCERVA